ncbi:MAG TPA: sugar phosphate isomerase/epimerase [Firmicutes bacterium]|nr:sugar phosphate isomerase/epimerase [Bacillota bacterium]
MQIGVRDNCVGVVETLEEKMQVLKELDYDFLELVVPREELERSAVEVGAYYKELVGKTGLPILQTSMGHFTDFAAKTPAEQQKLVADVTAMVRLTKEIGADAILLATREQLTAPIPELAAIYRRELTAVADEAASAGITLALEHVGGYKPYLLAELVKAIGHPAFRIYFDMGNCYYVGEDPVEQAQICAPLIAQLHIKGGPTTPLAAMPLVEICKILETAGFSGRGCLELAVLQRNMHLTEARGLLKRNGYWKK